MSSETEAACPICGAHSNAMLKCSGCKQQVYCGKDHQRQDWPRHKSVCKAWEVHESPELGRYLLASRDLNPGDSIISESPLVWGPALHTDQRVCIGCGKQCTSIDTRCTTCLWPACQMNCPGLIDKNRHGLECLFLVKARIVPRCDVLLVIRMLTLWRKKSKSWTSLEQFLSHEESRGPGTTAYEETQNVTQHIERLLSNIEGGKEIVSKICGLIDVNALETVPPEGSVAIYKTACLLEHSCLANTKHSFAIDDKGAPRITVKALCFIKKGDHLSTMYTHALWATMARRAHLRETKYFSCHCKRCADPTELGTHLGTLTASEVMQFTGKLEEDVDEAMAEARKDKLIDLLSRLTALLHPSHQQCITVSHSLIQLLSENNPKKPELCKRIIGITKVLDPYGARLSLYTAVALRELSTCPGEDEKSLLSKAISLLQFEPPNSPGKKFKELLEDEL
ncbi:SET domain-containing protein SmydA-8-like isoform X2 [Colletes gigas]|uniref:SET domain-containing protein SmydA-8-like isoform X2 n=1 Tax=Colletes gigas TaxID=935657 RepID=UPI001C9B7001|nr:SET domain-containing protein SmydA-8-like isoform X2 [Colletes gigas]